MAEIPDASSFKDSLKRRICLEGKSQVGKDENIPRATALHPFPTRSSKRFLELIRFPGLFSRHL